LCRAEKGLEVTLCQGLEGITVFGNHEAKRPRPAAEIVSDHEGSRLFDQREIGIGVHHIPRQINRYEGIPTCGLSAQADYQPVKKLKITVAVHPVSCPDDPRKVLAGNLSSRRSSQLIDLAEPLPYTIEKPYGGLQLPRGNLSC